MSTLKCEISCLTDPGLVRTNNEDDLIVCSDLEQNHWVLPGETFVVPDGGSVLIVADGMGGEAAGEEASAICVASLKSFLGENLNANLEDEDVIECLRSSLLFAHENILNYVKDNSDKQGMGTTCTICYLKKDQIFISWVGDSRVYRYSKNGKVAPNNFGVDNLEILTDDHSKVWDMVLNGQLSPEESRVHIESNIITQSLGDIFKPPKVDNRIFPLYKGDIIIACSDGLNSMISDKAIHDIVDVGASASILNDNLIDAAKRAGGKDNITIILARLIEGPIFMTDTLSDTDYVEPEEITKPVVVENAKIDVEEDKSKIETIEKESEQEFEFENNQEKKSSTGLRSILILLLLGAISLGAIKLLKPEWLPSLFGTELDKGSGEAKDNSDSSSTSSDEKELPLYNVELTADEVSLTNQTTKKPNNPGKNNRTSTKKKMDKEKFIAVVSSPSESIIKSTNNSPISANNEMMEFDSKIEFLKSRFLNIKKQFDKFKEMPKKFLEETIVSTNMILLKNNISALEEKFSFVNETKQKFSSIELTNFPIEIEKIIQDADGKILELEKLKSKSDQGQFEDKKQDETRDKSREFTEELKEPVSISQIDDLIQDNTSNLDSNTNAAGRNVSKEYDEHYVEYKGWIKEYQQKTAYCFSKLPEVQGQPINISFAIFTDLVKKYEIKENRTNDTRTRIKEQFEKFKKLYDENGCAKINNGN